MPSPTRGKRSVEPGLIGGEVNRAGILREAPRKDTTYRLGPDPAY